jgi:DNA-binding MarR family transcriptional regulator
MNSGDSSPRYRALLQLLRAADTIWDASRVFFARWDLSPSQFNVLNLLRGCPEGQSQTELSRELIMHRSNVTGLVDRLEERGLVQRCDVKGDRRAYRVVLTPAGEELLKEILPGYFDGAEHLWSDVPARRIQEMTSDLQTLTVNAERMAAEAERSHK